MVNRLRILSNRSVGVVLRLDDFLVAVMVYLLIRWLGL